jgi:hypothetical protein
VGWRAVTSRLCPDLAGAVPGGKGSSMSEYRYLLQRSWTGANPGPRALWVMLNPSTANDRQDDPTIRRCAAFSTRQGASGLSVVNLYALRCTDPGGLWRHLDPVGPENDSRIAASLAAAAAGGWLVVCAWGARAEAARAAEVLAAISGAGIAPLTLGLTRRGHPRHPLYVAAATKLVPYTP